MKSLPGWKTKSFVNGRWKDDILTAVYESGEFSIRITFGEQRRAGGGGVVLMALFPSGSLNLINPEIKFAETMLITFGFPANILSIIKDTEGDV